MADEASDDASTDRASAWRSPVPDLAMRLSTPPSAGDLPLAAAAFARSVGDQLKALDGFVPKLSPPTGLEDLLAKLDLDRERLLGVAQDFAGPGLGELGGGVVAMRDSHRGAAFDPAILANAPEARTARAMQQVVDRLDAYQASAERALAAETARADRAEARADRAEAREATMLRLTRAGVSLAVIFGLAPVVLGILALVG
jgi:hypothetical protein